MDAESQLTKTPTLKRAREARGGFSRHRRGRGNADFFVEVEAQGVSAEFDGESRILQASDAADFDARSGHLGPLCRRGKEFGQGDRRDRRKA